MTALGMEILFPRRTHSVVDSFVCVFPLTTERSATTNYLRSLSSTAYLPGAVLLPTGVALLIKVTDSETTVFLLNTQ